MEILFNILYKYFFLLKTMIKVKLDKFEEIFKQLC